MAKLRLMEKAKVLNVGSRHKRSFHSGDGGEGGGED